MSENIEKISLLPRFEAISRKLARDCKTLKNLDKTWDIKGCQTILEGMEALTDELSRAGLEVREEMDDRLGDIRGHLNSQEYAESFKEELKNLDIPFTGEFPVYEIPPFKLNVSLDNYEVKLFLGRKNERSSLMNPGELARWVSARHRRVSGRKFNANGFMKDLLDAYKVVNQIKFREKDVAWGRAVPMNDIYDVLTIKQSSRQDYPKQFFSYDLGLLKEMPSIFLDIYSFELGFARNQARAISVVDSLGRESRIASLTVYKGGE